MVQQRRELKFGLDPSCERERQPTGSDLPRFRLPCAGQVGWLDVPLGCIPSLPRTPRRVQLPLCSPGSTVLWTHLTSGRYSWQACPLGGSLRWLGFHGPVSLLNGETVDFELTRRKVSDR